MYKNYAKLRDAKGMNDHQVSLASGVATSTLTSWKKGDYTPKLDKLRKIAAVLGVTVDDLIEEAS